MVAGLATLEMAEENNPSVLSSRGRKKWESFASRLHARALEKS